MPEWSKGPDSSSGVATRVGSNPTQDNYHSRGTGIETRHLHMLLWCNWSTLGTLNATLEVRILVGAF